MWLIVAVGCFFLSGWRPGEDVSAPHPV